MIKRILVPLDGSRHAEMALFTASAIARRCGAELRLIQVCDPEKTPSTGANLERDRAWMYVDRIRRSRGSADGEVTAVIRVGNPGEEILREADPARCDLIVMATHGHRGLWRLFLGGVTDHCIHHSPIPVLLVRSYGNTGGFGVGRVVVSVAGTPESEEAIPAGIELANIFGAPVALVRGVPRTEGPEAAVRAEDAISDLLLSEARRAAATRYLEGLAERLRKEGTTVTGNVLVDDHPFRAILASAPDDLVVMATHPRGPMFRALLGSVADELLHKNSGPVLIVPTHPHAFPAAAGSRAWKASDAEGIVA